MVIHISFKFQKIPVSIYLVKAYFIEFKSI